MAINGWYVKKIITDIQEGKVDEFIQKEGKWFNYIKGEDTEHSNAADNFGEHGGNLDPTEFSVQGIGALQVDAVVLSGTTPALGGNVQVSFTGGGNWSSTGFSSYNITSLPSTGTFTIIPDAGYAVSAVDFTASYTVSWISSITFVDNGTPGVASNTITGTITFDTSQAISSTAPLSATVTLDVIAAPSLIEWSADIVVNGVFGVNTEIGGSISITSSYSSLSVVSSSNNQIVYNITKLVSAGSNEVLNLLYTPSFNVLGATPNVDFSDIEPTELSQYSSASNLIGESPHQSSVVINYTPQMESLVDFNNQITVNLNSQLGFCFFDVVSGNDSNEPYGLPDDGGVVQIPIQNNLGPATVVLAGGIVQSVGGGVTTYDIAAGDTSFDIFLLPNTTGSNVTGTMTITSNNNTTGSSNDIIHVEQGLQNNVVMSVALQGPTYTDPQNNLTSTPWTYEVLPTVGNNGYFNSLDGVASNPIVNNQGVTQIRVKVQLEEPQAEQIYSTMHVVYDDPDVSSDWITTSANSGSSGLSSASRVFEISPNTSIATTRGAKIRYFHPADNTVSGEIKITQEAAYSSSVNTLKFSNTTNTSSDFTYSDSEIIEVDHNAATVSLFANVPEVDLIDNENPFSNSLANPTFNIPSVGTYFFNNTNFLGNVAIVSAVNGNEGIPWWSNVSSTPVDGLAPITNSITFDIQENKNVLVGDPDFPVSRQFTLRGFNPENTSATPDDTIVIKQKARPCARWNGGPSGFLAPATPESTNSFVVPFNYSSSNGISLPVKANGGTPNVSGYAVKSNSGNWFTPASSVLINSISVSSTNNTDNYIVNVNLKENFTENEKEFTLGCYDSSILNSATENPTSHGIAADPITILVPPTLPVLEVADYSSLNDIPAMHYAGTGLTYNIYDNLDSYNQIYFGRTVIAPSTFEGSISLPMSFNGGTPNIDEVSYLTTPSSSQIIGTPPWISAPSIDGSGNLLINFNSTNTSGSLREFNIKITHAVNANIFINIKIRQLS